MNALTILDGGMGVELMARGQSTGGGLWSAQALLQAPETVADIHRDYIKAGASIIITNSYSTIPSYLAKGGMAEQYLSLTQRAGEIARSVADEFDGQVRVAGSLPPLDESYRFDLAPVDEEARPVYESLVEALSPYVDLFVCETMSCAREGRNAALAAAASGKPFWVAWSLNDDPGRGLRSSETVREAYAAVVDLEPEAYLFNCSTPEAISAAVSELRALTDRSLGVYPNLFHVPKDWTLDNDVSVAGREMTVEEYIALAQDWRSQGVSIIGGCCGVGPRYIEALAAMEA